MHFFKKKSSNQSLSLQQLKKNLQINFEPENAKPTSHYQSFYIDIYPGDKATRNGYVSDFLGTGEPGIIVHGTRDGKISIVLKGIRERRGNVRGVHYSPREFYQYLILRHSLDLAKDKRPLHLMSCYSGRAEKNSGKLSVAQELANVTQRSIWAYGGHEKLYLTSGGLTTAIGNTDFVTDSNDRRINPRLIKPHPPKYR